MCGIFGLVRQSKISATNFQTYTKGFYDLMSRGPDQQQLTKIDNTLIGFTRLSIMQLGQSAMQPYCFDVPESNDQIIFVCNGEIYNFKQLSVFYQLENIENRDCLIIPKLYIKFVREHGPQEGFSMFVDMFKHQVKGEFAFALFKFDKESRIEEIILGRDMLGVRPLYVSTSLDNKYAESFVFGSSIGSLVFYQGDVDDFEPGTVSRYCFDQNSGLVEVHTERFDWIYEDQVQCNQELEEQKKEVYEQLYLKEIRDSLVQSVRLRMTADQPICFLLSGGLDSSLVCSIAQSLSDRPIHTFCCGVAEEGQPSNTNDIINARKVAQFLGTVHTEVTFTKQEAIEVIPKIVKYCATQDVTTIRASIGMYFVCKYIQEKTQFKVIMSSDISDEILVYLFAFELENGIQIHKAAKTLVKEVHKYDVVRVDRIVSNACSLEARLPFSDQSYINACWQVPQDLRHPKVYGHGKYWLRKAFDHSNWQQSQQYVDPQDKCEFKQWLPDEVLWRVKSAFSDELMSNQEETLIQLINKHFGDERGHYKELFIQQYGPKRLNILKHYWQPIYFNESDQIIQKDYQDPSATTLKCFNLATLNKFSSRLSDQP